MKKDFLLSLIAKMYYVDNINQSDIAKEFGISPMMVSRSLDRAKKEGIVSFDIKTPHRINWNLGLQLKEKYPALREALVVMTEEKDDAREQVGRVAAGYVQELLKKDSVLGISWGKSILRFVEFLSEAGYPNIIVAQMSGSFLCVDAYQMIPSNLVKKASDQIGAVPMFLNTPMFVASREVRQSLMSDRLLQHLESLYDKMDITVYGLSDIDQMSTMQSVGVITPEEIEELKRCGAIGDVMGYFINEDGDIVKWSKSDCYMGASLKTAARASHAVCLATGAKKRRIVDIALRRSYMNTLIVSYDLAVELLQ